MKLRYVVISFALMLVTSTQVLCEEPAKQEVPVSSTDLLRLDNAQTHIREVMLQAQLAIMPHSAVVQEICKTYKIVPCDNLDKVIDMSTGKIRRPVAPPAPKPSIPPAKAKGGTP